MAGASCTCTPTDLLRGITTTGGAARPAKNPSNFANDLSPVTKSCRLASLNPVSVHRSGRKTPQYALGGQTTELVGSAVLVIGDCFERMLVDRACDSYGVGDRMFFAGEDGTATFACKIPVGCTASDTDTASSKHTASDAVRCLGELTLGVASMVGAGSPPWFAEAYLLEKGVNRSNAAGDSEGRLHRFMAASLLGLPAHAIAERLIANFTRAFGPPSLVTVQSLAWDYARWASGASKLPCSPCTRWQDWAPPLATNRSAPRGRVRLNQALHWWAVHGGAHVEQWRRDAGALARSVAQAVTPTAPVYWRTRYVPVTEASTVRAYDDNDGTPGTPILPAAFGTLNEVARASHKEWGTRLLDWGRYMAPYTGWYYADGLHPMDWVSHRYFQLLLSVAVAHRDERALAASATCA